MFAALAIASLVIYFSVRANLHDQVDFSLIQLAQEVAAKSGGAYNQPQKPTAPTAGHGTAGGPLLESNGSYFQLIPNLATVRRGQLSAFVPLAEPDELVAKGLAPPYFRDVRFRGVEVRLYTTPLGSASDGLVRTARPL
ncbi:MAG: hypothetical protein ACRDLP_10525, partial [Solirubrobacteraceae bacterium]